MLYLLLPAYNEAGALPALLASARAALPPPFQIVVVDDGSSDDTARIAAPLAEVIRHPRNLGLGAAMLTGIKAVCSKAADRDVLVAMDADNTHDPALIPALVARLDAGSDLVIASRYAPGGAEIGLSLPRKIMSRGASTLLRLFFPIPGARDYTCGYRAYRVSLLKRALNRFGDRLIEETGFTCMAELLIKLAHLGARVSEVPLVLRYDLKAGASKMRVLRTIGRYLRLIRRRRMLSDPSDSFDASDRTS